MRTGGRGKRRGGHTKRIRSAYSAATTFLSAPPEMTCSPSSGASMSVLCWRFIISPNDALARNLDVPFVVVPIVTDNAEVAARMIDRVIREKEDSSPGMDALVRNRRRNIAEHYNNGTMLSEIILP